MERYINVLCNELFKDIMSFPAIGVANDVVCKTRLYICYEVKEWLNDQEQVIIITWSVLIKIVSRYIMVMMEMFNN